MMLKAGLIVTILDVAIMALALFIANFFHLAPSTQSVLIYALLGKFFYMMVVNTACFSVANLFISSSRNFPRTTLLSLTLCMSSMITIVYLWSRNDNEIESHNIFSPVIKNPLPFATVFLPVIVAYATCYYFARRADKKLQQEEFPQHL